MTSNQPMGRSTATSTHIASIRGNHKSLLEAAFQKAIYPILKNNVDDDDDADDNDDDDNDNDDDGGSVDNEARKMINQRPDGSESIQNHHVSMSTSMSMSEIPMRMLLQGPSQCGKTSLAMDLAYSIATSPSTCCTIVNANNGQNQNNGDADANADGDMDMDMDTDTTCEQYLKCTHCQLPFVPTESSCTKNVPFDISSYCSCCAVLFLIPEWKREQSLLDFPLPCYEYSESASSGSRSRSRNQNQNQENYMQSNREGKDDTIDDADDDTSSHFWRDHERFQESMRKLEQQEQKLNGNSNINGNINGGDSSRNASATAGTRNINRKMRLRAQRRMVALQRIRIKYIHSCQHLVESLASTSMSMSTPISMASESDVLSQPPSPKMHTCGLSVIIVDDLDSYIRKANHNNDANENSNSSHRGELDESVRLLFHDGNRNRYWNGNGANDTSTSADSGDNNKGQEQHEIGTHRHENGIPQMTTGGQQQQQQQQSFTSVTQERSSTVLSSGTKKTNSYSNSSTTETMRLLQLLAIMSDTCNHLDNCKRILSHNQGRNLEIPIEDQPTPVSAPMKLLTCINTDNSFSSSNDLNHMMQNYVTTIGTLSKNDNSNKNKNKKGGINIGDRRDRHHHDEIIIDNFESMDAEQYKRHNSSEIYHNRHINTHQDLAAQSQIVSTWLMTLKYDPWQASTLSTLSPVNDSNNDTTSNRNGIHSENSNGKGIMSNIINIGENLNAEAIYSIGWSSSAAISEMWDCRIDEDGDDNGDDEQVVNETDVSAGGYGEVEDDETNSIYWNIQ